jgi:hypothetical protein
VQTKEAGFVASEKWLDCSSAWLADWPPRPFEHAALLVEWVYKVKWGHQEEFFDIFKKTQIPVLDQEKQLGCAPVAQKTITARPRRPPAAIAR